MRAGFHVILGNPPWERIKLQEKEFFAGRDAAIAEARTAAARRKLIKALPKTDPALHAAYQGALRDSECASHYIRNSGRYPLTGGGDINTYAVFAGLARQLTANDGRAGIVVPTGIATDYTYRDYFAAIVNGGQLVSLYDFENRRGIFPDVDSRMKFSLLTLRGRGPESADPPTAQYAFFLHDAAELADPERRFTLDAADLALLNPDTRTMIAFRTRRDVELVLDIHRRAPHFVETNASAGGWVIDMVQGTFHSSNDSQLFIFETDAMDIRKTRPLFEPRMFHQYDHRFATYSEKSFEYAEEKHTKPDFVAKPRYRVPLSDLESRLGAKDKWVLAYRRIARSTDERTMIASLMPSMCINENSVMLVNQEVATLGWIKLLANLNSFSLDYVLRQSDCFSISNSDTRQLPVLPPEAYDPAALQAIVPRVLELTYTAWDLAAFADDLWRDANSVGVQRAGPQTASNDPATNRAQHAGPLREALLAQWEANAAETGGHGDAVPPDWLDLLPSPASGRGAGGEGKGHFPRPPFKWDAARRARLRAELDGLYGHLYGLSRDELAYILDTFPIVRRKDEDRFGEYRTKRLVLAAYDRWAEEYHRT